MANVDSSHKFNIPVRWKQARTLLDFQRRQPVIKANFIHWKLEYIFFDSKSDEIGKAFLWFVAWNVTLPKYSNYYCIIAYTYYSLY